MKKKEKLTLSVLTRKAKTFFRIRLSIPQPWENIGLLGKTFHVRAGTIRKEPDYDDAWLLACALNSKIIFDVGSNIGQAAILMLQNPRVEQIVLFDPNPAALSQAAENLIYNNLSEKAHFVCTFIGDQDDNSIPFWTVGIGAAGSLFKGHSHTAARKNSSYFVSTMTLDSLAKRCNIFPDFIKIDVEGAENLVLEGSTTLARNYSPRYLVEMHAQPELTMVENARKVIEWCRTVKYKAWYMTESMELIKPEQIAHRGRCHIFLQSDREQYPAWLRDIQQGAALDIVKLPTLEQ